MRKQIVAGLLLLLLLLNEAIASDETGKFMTGGGVGSVSCPEFLDSMATARQRGGLSSLGGVTAIAPFAMYVAGFQTGYNMGVEGVYDVFAPLGDNANEKVLISVEAWCSKHPEATFDFGLFDLLKLLDENATME
jgi:hypothetical protein